MGKINYLVQKLVQFFAGKNSNFGVEVAKGNIEGYLPIFIAGENESIGTTPELVRSSGGATYPYPSTAVKFNFVSTDANDTLLGTGARIVYFQGLDSNFDRQSEFINLNGLTGTLTSLEYMRVEAFQVLTSDGSGNLGTLKILNGTDNLGEILPQEGSMRQQVFTVPNNKIWFAEGTSVTAGKDDEVAVFAKSIGADGTPYVFSKNFIYQNNYLFSNKIEVGIPGPVDLQVTARKTGSAGNARTAALSEFLEADVNEL